MHRDWIGFSIAGIALVINGIGIRFPYRQVKANDGSARGAIISVESASRQTELLILANRPWLLVKVTYNGTGYTFTANNKGKSPAIIMWRDPFIPAEEIPIGTILLPGLTHGFGFAEGEKS